MAQFRFSFTMCFVFYLFFVFSTPCWFSAAVLQRTLCVWHKLSWTGGEILEVESIPHNPRQHLQQLPKILFNHQLLGHGHGSTQVLEYFGAKPP